MTVGSMGIPSGYLASFLSALPIHGQDICPSKIDDYRTASGSLPDLVAAA